MPLDLVRDVFEPVALRVENRRDSLIGLQRHKRSGIEGWLKVEAHAALGNRVERFCNNGPDLVLRDGDSTVMVELKAATDLNTTDDISSPRGGVMKYCHEPGFAGCLFLGDGTDDSKIETLSKGDVELRPELRRKFQAGEHTWIVGLLTSRTPAMT